MLPLGQRVLEKLISLIDEELGKIGCQKLSLPLLQSPEIWNKSGRLNQLKGDIFTTDTGMVLSPTAEEEITSLVKRTVFSHKHLPQRLYQIGPKFRNEARPRNGLFRMKEFLMKDLYTFDKDLTSTKESYEQVVRCYESIFEKLEIPAVRTKADSGAMGGSSSEEFHLLNEHGEDLVLICGSCRSLRNKEVTEPCCNSPSLSEHKGLELAHAFILGNRYSKAFEATFTDANQKKQIIQMGCFGIGVSRLMAAVAEHHSDDQGIFWPDVIAPFNSAIVLKAPIAAPVNIPKDTLIDDRDSITISRKIKDMYLIGIPNIYVFGKHWIESARIEYHERKSKTISLLTLDDFNGRHARPRAA